MAKRLALVFLAVCGLCCGAAAYVTGRSSASVYFLKGFPQFYLPSLYGPLGRWIPDFFHVFSFSLIGIGLFSKSRLTRIAWCVFWLGIDSLFEVGQKYAAQVVPYIPSWFEGIYAVENTRNFFIHGTFDYNDLGAFVIGAFAAYIIGEIVIGGEAYAKGEKAVLAEAG